MSGCFPSGLTLRLTKTPEVVRAISLLLAIEDKMFKTKIKWTEDRTDLLEILLLCSYQT